MTYKWGTRPNLYGYTVHHKTIITPNKHLIKQDGYCKDINVNNFVGNGNDNINVWRNRYEKEIYREGEKER